MCSFKILFAALALFTLLTQAKGLDLIRASVVTEDIGYGDGESGDGESGDEGSGKDVGPGDGESGDGESADDGSVEDIGFGDGESGAGESGDGGSGEDVGSGHGESGDGESVDDGSGEGPVPTTTAAPLTILSPYECPAGWIDGGYLGCFHFYHTEKTLTWAEAQGACEVLGGYLAEIKTEEQYNLVESMAIIEEKFSGVESWWLGLSDMGHEERWIWSHTVADADFTSWVPGHPNTAAGNKDDCVVIALSEHFHWKDISCFNTNHTSPSPICQRDVEGVTSTTSTTTEPAPTTATFQGCSNGWSQYQNSCYKMITSKKYWSSAIDYCRKEGAELLSIHSDGENKFVYDIVRRDTSDNYIWIGGNDESVEGLWEWVDGSAWAYENWITGQPDSGRSQNSLAMDMDKNGKWRDLGDSDNYKFVCKMY